MEPETMTEEQKETGRKLALEGGFLAGQDIIDRAESDRDRLTMVLQMTKLFEHEFIVGLQAALTMKLKLPAHLNTLGVTTLMAVSRGKFVDMLNELLGAMVADQKKADTEAKKENIQ